MLKEHGILCDSEAPRKKIKADLRSLFSEQELTNKYNEEKKTQEVLRKCVDKQTVHQALLRLIVYHDLPLSMVEWPELYTLVFAINHQATDFLWTSYQSTAIHVTNTFEERRLQVARILQGA